MSYRLVSSCTRLLSPAMRRRAPSAPPALGHAAAMMSSGGQPPKPPKSAVKSSTQKKHDTESSAVEKGDTYKAGEAYFSYNPYSFYDIENNLEARRLKQPCSGDKMRMYCQLRPDEEPQRRLLPDPWGYLVEWPGKKKPNPKYGTRPLMPIIDGTYKKLMRNPKTDPYFRTRLPL